MKLFAVVFFLVLALFTASAARADSYGVLTGVPVAAQITIGPGGLANIIDLTFNTLDNLTWTIRCTRDDGSLGRCSNLMMGTYEARGTFRSNTVLAPDSMTFLKKGEEGVQRVPVVILPLP